MDKKISLILPLGLFLVFFLIIFLLRELNLTGKAIGTIIIKNNAPALTSDPVINNTAPNTNSVISCIPGNYFDIDNHPKYKDYWRWYRNNLLVNYQFSQTLNLALSGVADAGDVLRCMQTTSDGFSNSTARNSSAVTVVTLSIPPSGGGGGGSGTTSTICVVNYYCNPWSECINNTQTRECIDLNRCDTNTRFENIVCFSPLSPSTILQSTIIQEPINIIEEYPRFSFTVITISLTLFLALLITAVILSRIHPKKKKGADAEIKRAKTELYRYIKQALDLGYSPDNVKDALLKAGWPKSMIDSALSDLV